MEPLLNTYKRIVTEQPNPDDAWFREAIHKARAGDAEARRQITGSCLGVALAVAEEAWSPASQDDLFDLIQDANSALLDAVATFAGTQADEFVDYARQTVAQRLRRQS